MYYTTMTKNGNPYNREVLYDKASNTIMHFSTHEKQYDPYLQFQNK